MFPLRLSFILTLSSIPLKPWSGSTQVIQQQEQNLTCAAREQTAKDHLPLRASFMCCMVSSDSTVRQRVHSLSVSFIHSQFKKLCCFCVRRPTSGTCLHLSSYVHELFQTPRCNKLTPAIHFAAVVAQHAPGSDVRVSDLALQSRSVNMTQGKHANALGTNHLQQSDVPLCNSLNFSKIKKIKISCKPVGC